MSLPIEKLSLRVASVGDAVLSRTSVTAPSAKRRGVRFNVSLYLDPATGAYLVSLLNFTVFTLKSLGLDRFNFCVDVAIMSAKPQTLLGHQDGHWFRSGLERLTCFYAPSIPLRDPSAVCMRSAFTGLSAAKHLYRVDPCLLTDQLQAKLSLLSIINQSQRL